MATINRHIAPTSTVDYAISHRTLGNLHGQIETFYEGNTLLGYTWNIFVDGRWMTNRRLYTTAKGAVLAAERAII